jgi:fumarate reductase subunit C
VGPAEKGGGALKLYHRPVQAAWWLKRRPYMLFIIRELTSLFVGIYCLLLLVILYKLGQGEKAYNAMLAVLRSGPMVALHVVTLVFTVYHSITWFNLTPKAIVIPMGEKRVPDVLIAGSNYVAWVILSVILYWIIVRA